MSRKSYNIIKESLCICLNRHFQFLFIRDQHGKLSLPLYQVPPNIKILSYTQQQLTKAGINGSLQGIIKFKITNIQQLSIYRCIYLATLLPTLQKVNNNMILLTKSQIQAYNERLISQHDKRLIKNIDSQTILYDLQLFREHYQEKQIRNLTSTKTFIIDHLFSS